jgi:hypothetical protein
MDEDPDWYRKRLGCPACRDETVEAAGSKWTLPLGNELW